LLADRQVQPVLALERVLPVRPGGDQLLAHLGLLAVGEQVGHPDLVDDEQQQDRAAGQQQLAEAARDGQAAVTAGAPTTVTYGAVASPTSTGPVAAPDGRSAEVQVGL